MFGPRLLRQTAPIESWWAPGRAIDGVAGRACGYGRGVTANGTAAVGSVSAFFISLVCSSSPGSRHRASLLSEPVSSDNGWNVLSVRGSGDLRAPLFAFLFFLSQSQHLIFWELMFDKSSPHFGTSRMARVLMLARQVETHSRSLMFPISSDHFIRASRLLSPFLVIILHQRKKI